MLIDGIEMSGLHNGSVDFSQISINNIERIEIIEGPLSNIYGTLGATINLISKLIKMKRLLFQQNHILNR